MKNRTLITFLICLPVILMMGLFNIHTHGGPFSQNDAMWVRKIHGSEKYNMLILGDSRVYRGVSTDIMNTVLTEYRILNFAFSSGGLNKEIFIASENHFTAVQDRPRIIVLGVTPHSLTPDSYNNSHYKQYELHPPYKGVFQRYINFLWTFFDEYTFPELMFYLNSVIVPFDDILSEEVHPDGWIASWGPGDIDDPEQALHIEREDIPENYVSDEIVKEVIDYVAYWHRQGIIVFAFRPPTTAEVAAFEDDFRHFNEANFVAQFEAAGGIWLDFPADGYRSYDGSHLHSDAAVQFSNDLALAISEYLDPP